MDTFKKHALIMALVFFGLNMNPTNAMADSSTPANVQVIELPDKLNTIIDSLANDADVKYYSFTAIRGQRVLINQINPENSPWLIEYKESDTWKTKHGDEAFATPNMNPGQQVQIRVSKKSYRNIKKDEHYKILFGSAPRLADTEVTGDVEHFNTQFGKHRAYRVLNWQTRIVDYKGHPLEGVRVTLELNTNQNSNSKNILSQGISNKSGFFRTSLALPECQGEDRTEPFWLWQYGFRTKWQLTYNTGYWFAYPDSHENGGAGSKTGIKTSFVHICTQKIIR
ncbi:hypothetical protein K5D32_13390 [Pseudomonas cichorii]|uniref:hypothetical protein n=1 Tax=Pseudomonas cichorii TaxID=36746 RepID=UPI001C8A9F1E|nr:hypothetical protein [Pseudomonas cichorii]MBX8530662.1 hypothetical protein [Pseudomonas cichorii]